MKIKYTGTEQVFLMHEGKVWIVNPNDEIPEVKELPQLPNFEVVKEVADDKKGAKTN
ncbi:hypothetical protein [Alicyclobacillus fastidiosus]|uniref:Uncharacterized protein n=1 Tax=Alicyclobacillus fastidiosus TaxID=392011 RepID=A0ABV5ALB7_9BACL|nr:hypothetical protein [Alicyclobacillus fastidiosus]WEH08478.1 hypothetical protein PYS47_17550 [Alicyclobacillus fastidiosus]